MVQRGATVETANRRNGFHRRRQEKVKNEKEKKNAPHKRMQREERRKIRTIFNDLVAVMAPSQGMHVVSSETDNSIVRRFKALPSRPFGAAYSPFRQRMRLNADN